MHAPPTSSRMKANQKHEKMRHRRRASEKGEKRPVSCTVQHLRQQRLQNLSTRHFHVSVLRSQRMQQLQAGSPSIALQVQSIEARQSLEFESRSDSAIGLSMTRAQDSQSTGYAVLIGDPVALKIGCRNVGTSSWY
jgi:hypothetical protein